MTKRLNSRRRKYIAAALKFGLNLLRFTVPLITRNQPSYMILHLIHKERFITSCTLSILTGQAICLFFVFLFNKRNCGQKSGLFLPLCRYQRLHAMKYIYHIIIYNIITQIFSFIGISIILQHRKLFECFNRFSAF